MPPSRPGKLRARRGRCAHLRRPRGGGFTLIELIVVLALLAIVVTLVVANVGGFVRGRGLNFEARRLLSLTHFAQSRAVSEGVPVVLWVDTKNSTYGLCVQSSFSDASGGDTRAVTYTLEPNLTLETALPDSTIVSEQDDEKLGLPTDLVAIRFTPDGFFDESSVARITIRLNAANALDLVPSANRLGYEIQPGAILN